MSYSNGASPSHNTRHRHGNPVSDSEFSDWFDSDGRLVKEAAMKEALFRCEWIIVVMCFLNCVHVVHTM